MHVKHYSSTHVLTFHLGFLASLKNLQDLEETSLKRTPNAQYSRLPHTNVEQILLLTRHC